MSKTVVLLQFTVPISLHVTIATRAVESELHLNKFWASGVGVDKIVLTLTQSRIKLLLLKICLVKKKFLCS